MIAPLLPAMIATTKLAGVVNILAPMEPLIARAELRREISSMLRAITWMKTTAQPVKIPAMHSNNPYNLILAALLGGVRVEMIKASGKRLVRVANAGCSWAVEYIERRRGQHFRAATFHKSMRSRASVSEWIKQQTNLKEK